jgi:DUF4097 and DUF4098 domain-containing protein YvlB
MEEKMRILNLLKEGKITTEEASSLLDALEQKSEEKRHKEFVFHMPHIPKAAFAGFGKFPEMVTKIVTDSCSAAVDKAMGESGEVSERRFAAKENVVIRAVSGDIDIEGVKSSEITLDACCGLQKIEDKANELILNMISNDIDLKVPFKTNIRISSVSGDIECTEITGDLEVQTASGDLELEKIIGKVEIKSASGDIDVKEFSGAIDVKTASGDIEVEFSEFEDSSIETKSGDVSIVLPKKIDAIIELLSEDGEIEVSIDKSYEELEKKSGYLKIGLGNKTKKLYCHTKSGDIELKQE